MRYFRAFYETEDSMSTIDALQPIHTQFDDKVFVLPYARRGFGEGVHERLCCTLIAKDGSIGERTVQEHLERALRIWGISDPAQTRLEECTIEGCFLDDMHMFTCASFEESQIKQLLSLQNTYSFVSRSSNGLNERIIERPLDEKAASSRAAQTSYTRSLQNELANIFAPSKQGGSASDEVSFAPISYIVEGNAPSDATEAIDILLGAMKSAGRMGTSHVFALNIDDYVRWPFRDSDCSYGTYINHQLIRAIEGNILEIRYGSYESKDGYDLQAYKLFTSILDLIESAQCKTQIIFSVPEGKTDLVMRLRKRFNKPFVLLQKDSGTNASNESYEHNLEAMQKMAKSCGMSPDESMGTLLSKRMRSSNTPDLEDIFKEWSTYQDAKQDFPQYADVIDQAIELDGDTGMASAEERLQSLIGLEKVKEHINNVILRVEMSQVLMERGLPREPFSMHMAFLGAPGTGKTEVARLYTEILKDKGILSEGRLVSVSGGCGFNVEKAFEAAEGSVLFVDEAYGMLAIPGMVTEFIAQMENNRASTVVILAGYENRMNALLDSNPGFRSRIQTSIIFPDYTPDELRQIFAFMCESQNVHMDKDVDRDIRDIMLRSGKRADHGNARFARKLFEDAIGNQQVRLAKLLRKSPNAPVTIEELRTLRLEDVDKAASSMGVLKADPAVSAREELEGLIGLDKIKELVSARLDFAKMQKIKRDAGMDAPFVPMHMAFKGNPGTGKTEVARLVGRILHEEGVLAVGDFYECGRQDLVSPIVGNTAPMVEALFNDARGSVIFIDEAYSLLDGGAGHGNEAIDAMIAQMENLRDEVVVIFAGYTKEIEDLLASNPGFSSRVKTQIEFPDYSADELVEILHHMASRQGYCLAEGVDQKVREMAERAMRGDSFGNARFVRNLFEDALVRQSVRLAREMCASDTESAGNEASKLDNNTKAKLSTLIAEDFYWEEPSSPPCQIGFVA